MEISVMTNKRRIVVPARIWRKLGISKGIKVSFIQQNGKLMIQPLDKSYFESLAGILGTKGKMMKSLMDDKKSERQLGK